MANKSESLPFALMAWIKRDQEERIKHQENMVVKNYREDKEFVRLITFIVQAWNYLNLKEKILINSFAEKHNHFRCLSTGQRSAITSIYLKYYQENSFRA